MALATPNQLYRLNKLGRLEVVPGSTPMTHVDADREIKRAEGLCACGGVLAACVLCGDDRCLSCDPYDDDETCVSSDVASDAGTSSDGTQAAS